MSNPPHPDLDEYDDYDELNGLEQCPYCGGHLGGQTGGGPVVDATGRRFDSLYDTDPMAGAFYHDACWTARMVAINRREHATLTTFLDGVTGDE